MKIIFVVPYTPTLIRTRPYNLVRSLARRGHTVTLATLWESETERAALDALVTQGIEVLAAPLTRARAAANALGALAVGLPVQARYCWQPALAQALTRRLAAKAGPDFDLVHVEHLRGAEYGRHIYRSRPGRPLPIVWDSVDCISLLFEQAAQRSRSRLGRWMARFELPRTRHYEGRMVNGFDGVLATSARDQAALLALARQSAAQAGTAAPSEGAGRVRILPNGVDSEYFGPAAPAKGAAQVVLSGKMSYHANVTAALQLVTDIMPAVWQQRPDVKVVIAGSAPPRVVRALALQFAPRVEVTGYVPDLRPYLQAATVAAAPIAYGAGIQNKVLEAMASGVPVVASPQASSALAAQPGQDLLVAGEPAEFAAALLELLGSPQRRAAVGEAGRRYVLRHHHWYRIVGDLEGMYDEFIGAAAQHVS